MAMEREGGNAAYAVAVTGLYTPTYDIIIVLKYIILLEDNCGTYNGM